MSKSKRTDPSSIAKYRPGDLGERGTHPNDPDGEVFGDTHWPMPLPHEMGLGYEQPTKEHDK